MTHQEKPSSRTDVEVLSSSWKVFTVRRSLVFIYTDVVMQSNANSRVSLSNSSKFSLKHWLVNPKNILYGRGLEGF